MNTKNAFCHTAPKIISHYLPSWSETLNQGFGKRHIFYIYFLANVPTSYLAHQRAAGIVLQFTLIQIYHVGRVNIRLRWKARFRKGKHLFEKRRENYALDGINSSVGCDGDWCSIDEFSKWL